MWAFFVACSIIVTGLTCATLITACLQGVSWEKAFSNVWGEIKNITGLTAPTHTTPSYAPEYDVEMLQRIVNEVAKYSALSAENICYSVNSAGDFPIIGVQIVPLTDTSLEIAQQVAATIAKNAAIARGFAPDVETAVIPCQHGAMMIQIGIATTLTQCAALANYRQMKNNERVLNSGGGNHEIIDHELEQELDKIGGDCDA